MTSYRLRRSQDLEPFVDAPATVLTQVTPEGIPPYRPSSSTQRRHLMRKPLWIIPSLILFAAIGAPNASADTVDPSIMTKTTNTMGILSDMATLSGVIGMSPGTFTFTLTDPNGAMVGLGISGMQPVSASGVPVTAASAVIQTAPGEYTW